MTKVILINGAPRSGKDTAAALIEASVNAVYANKYRTYHHKFAKVLKDATHALHGVDVSANAYESCKETSMPEFFGMTPREAYISFSEGLVKPAYGSDFFGKILAKELAHVIKYTDLIGASYTPLFIISDCGFYDECMPIVDLVGKENVMLLNMQRDGCDYSCDSRDDLYIHGVERHVIENNAKPADISGAILQCLNSFLGGNNGS